MDNVNPNNSTVGLTPPLSPSAVVPPVIPSNKPYLSKLFSGRLNRAGNILGSIFIAIVLSALFSIILLLLVMFVDRKTVETSLPFLIIGLIIWFEFFAVSFTIRRLHDLNKTGYLAIILLPSYIVSFLAMAIGMSGSVIKDTSTVSIINMIEKTGLYTIYLYASQVFGLYLTFWPGTKEVNKYGSPSKHWTIKEILCLAEPGVPGTNNPTHKVNIVKLLLNIIMWLVIFLVALVSIVFIISFIQGFFRH